MAQFVLKIEKLSHIIGTAPKLEMARAYDLRPRLWLLFIYKATKDNKLRQFSFGKLHRILMTKKELFKFRLVGDQAGTLCLQPDSIEHTFLDCTVTTAFYLKAISRFNHENDTDITLSNMQIIFNDIPRLTHLTDYPRRRLHLFVIILKQYIYACKCLDKKPNMQEFQRKAV